MHEQETAAIAFEGTRRLASGTLAAVARAVRERLDQQADISVLVLDAQSSAAIDLDLRGTTADVERRYAILAAESATTATENDQSEGTDPSASQIRGRGRPRLGVVPREVTLLPRHWSWLASQPGGASVTLRRLVEQARLASSGRDRSRTAADATYRFLMHLAGNEIGFEEATRALFAGEREKFLDRISQWPSDVREHAEQLSEPVFV
jgi:hypothetical protein